MLNVTAAQARSQFGELMNRAAYGKERILLTRRGKVLAAIVPELWSNSNQSWVKNISKTSIMPRKLKKQIFGGDCRMPETVIYGATDTQAERSWTAACR